MSTIGSISTSALSALYKTTGSTSTSSSDSTTSSSSSSSTEEASTTAILAQASKVTLDALMEVLDQHFDDTSSLTAASSGMDPAELTSEYVTQSVLSAAPAMLESFAAANPDLTGDDLTEAFLEEILSALDEGFSSAGDTLSAISGGTYDASSSLDSTYSLISAALQGFVQSQSETDSETDS